MKHLKLIIAAIAFIVIPVATYKIFKKRSAMHTQWLSTGHPTKQNLKQYINASGRLKAQEEITVGALVAGRVEKLFVDDNDFVKKDQVLVELDDGIGYSAVKKAKAFLLQTQATYNYTKNFYARQKSLYEAGQLARDTFEGYTRDHDNSWAAVLQAEADLEIRQQKYDNLFIKAPEEGIIIAKKVNLGQMITSQFMATELFKIAKNLKKMEAEIDVDEADIGVVKIGQEAVFTVDSFPRLPFNSKVSQINYNYTVVDNVITYAIVLDVENPDLMLRPGMTTNVDIRVADVSDALCLPNKALRINRKVLEKIANKKGFGFESIPQTIDTKAKVSVWTVNNSSFKEVHVKLGVTDGRSTEVKKGLDVNSTVVFEALDPDRVNPVLTMGKMKV